MSFYEGFADELCKLAAIPGISKGTQAWAVSRGITAGVAGGLMAGMTLSMAQKGKPKKDRVPVIKGALAAGALSTALGLGKGIFERGIETKVLKAMTKGRY